LEARHQPQRPVEISPLRIVNLDAIEQAALDMEVDDLDAYLIDSATYCHELRQDVVALSALLQHALYAPNLAFNAAQSAQCIRALLVHGHGAGIGTQREGGVVLADRDATSFRTLPLDIPPRGISS
jgi:hypothetical protein